jgi:hypothetical protein
MVSRCAGGLATMAGFALWMAACAEAPTVKPPNRVVAGHPARIELEAVSLEPRCSSPYPISQLRVKLTADDGQAYATPIFTPNGPNTGGLAALDPAEVSGTVSFGQFITGLFYLPPVDLLPEVGSELVVNAWLTRQPNVKARLAIPPRFDCPQYLNLSGRSGFTGTPSAPGGPGEPGPAVRIAIGYLDHAGAKPLILVRVDDARGMRARTVISSDGPPLQIFLDGGVGGVGGFPLAPGPWPYGPMGPPFWGATAWGVTGPWNFTGPGGAGGDGGAAEIGYDEAAPELEGKVVIVNRGGSGGAGCCGSGRAGRPGPLPRTARVPVRHLFEEEIAHGVRIRVRDALDRAAGQST